MDTKKGSLEQSILDVWKGAAEMHEEGFDGRTKEYREHRAKLENKRVKREEKKNKPKMEQPETEHGSGEHAFEVGTKRFDDYTREITPGQVEEEIAELLSRGEIVARFNGSLEYGPRALCNRSIIYHGRDASVNVWLNKKLNRSEFMPFAPVTTAEVAPECFVDWSEDDPAADFMTMTYDCTEWFKTMCPACVHIDGTARPQIVRKDIQPQLHALLESYIQSTGEPAIINTSFNNHEEPINCSIEDALRSLSIGNVDALLIGDFLVESRPTSTHLSV